MDFDQQALDHFTDLARRGKHGGCSSGEERARKIALVILEYAGGLDEKALIGLAEFARVVSASYSTAKKLVE
jgi:hypothetical protein